MRKGIIVVVLALVLSLSVSAIAFAAPHGYTYFNDGNSGWISNGHHGHYWSGDFDRKVIIDKSFDWGHKWYRHLDRDGERYYCYDDKGNVHFYYGNVKWDKKSKWNKDGKWYYYYDDKGVAHYFYDDGDDWNYHSYVDKYGNTQYSRSKAEIIS